MVLANHRPQQHKFSNFCPVDFTYVLLPCLYSNHDSVNTVVHYTELRAAPVFKYTLQFRHSPCT